MEANSLDGFVPVAQVDEVPPGQARRVKVNGKTIALFNVSGFGPLDQVNNLLTLIYPNDIHRNLKPFRPYPVGT